jgi:hypothetical protein
MEALFLSPPGCKAHSKRRTLEGRATSVSATLEKKKRVFHLSLLVLLALPPRDGKGLRDFYHNRTNSILQQLKRNFWKIEDALFRIS